MIIGACDESVKVGPLRIRLVGTKRTDDARRATSLLG